MFGQMPGAPDQGAHLSSSQQAAQLSNPPLVCQQGLSQTS
jgi:hypothetical protein